MMTALTVHVDGVSGGWKSGNDFLRQVSFSLDLGDLGFLPVVGQSGLGKSTLLYILAGLKFPSSGRVSWTFPGSVRKEWACGDETLTTDEAASVRLSYFGFSFQDSTLSSALTVHENVELPLRLRGVEAPTRRDRVMTLLENVGISRLAQNHPMSLSGGEKQRAALAQAMIGDPAVLFADEPGGSLDPETRRGILQTIKEWVTARRGERAFVWITHNLDDVVVLQSQKGLHVARNTCIVVEESWLRNAAATQTLK